MTYFKALIDLAKQRHHLSSNQALAERLGVTGKAAVTHWIQGRSTPRGDTAIALANMVDINPSAFATYCHLLRTEDVTLRRSHLAWLRQVCRKADLTPPRSDLDPWEGLD